MQIEMFPMLYAEIELVRFLCACGGFPAFEEGLLESLAKQINENERPVISYKQRVCLWKMPYRFNIPEMPQFQFWETAELACFLIEALEHVHKSYWASEIATAHKRVIEEQLRSLATERVEWLSKRLAELRGEDVKDIHTRRMEFAARKQLATTTAQKERES